MTALAQASWPDLADARERGRDLLLVVPLGSCEQHGPHLPFDVDTTIADSVARGLVAASDTCVLAPPLGYGASGEHEAFPGTVSVGHAALAAMLVEIGRSAARWASRTLFVTGHGGNVEALVDATSTLRGERRDSAWWPCTVPGGDAHAGRSETSLLLALRPGAVRLDAARAGRREPVAALMPQLRAGGVRPVSPNGVLGDPAGASAQAGDRIRRAIVERLAAAVAAWRVGPDGRLASGAAA